MERYLIGLLATALLGGGAWAGPGPVVVPPPPAPGPVFPQALPPLIIPIFPLDIPFNYSWLTPFAGYTTYPGEPGSGFATRSDYLHLCWTVPPVENANHVRNKLRAMGVPLVRPEPMFLGRDPHIADGIRLPMPPPKPKPEEKNGMGD